MLFNAYYRWYGNESDRVAVRENNWFCKTNFHYDVSADGKKHSLPDDNNCEKENAYDAFNFALTMSFISSILMICFNVCF